MKIIGVTVGTTTPRSNLNQTNPKKADYIIGKEMLDVTLAAIQKDIEDLKYVPIDITAISNTAGTKECGTALDSLTISWAVNKEPTGQVISTGDTLTAAQRSITWNEAEIQAMGINAVAKLVHTFTVTATDERGKTDKASTSVAFENRVYYGTAPMPNAVDRNFILSLPKSIMTGTRKRTFDMSDAEGYYTWYATPVRLGACAFKVNGFNGGFNDPETILFENALGYEEPYYVYRSEYEGQTGVTVEVI